MNYSLEFVETEIIITADKFGRFASIEKLIDDVKHLSSTYRVDAVRVNDVTGEIVDVDKMELEEIQSKLTFPKSKECPTCNSEMTEGICYTTTSLKSFFWFGLSAQDLVFKSKEDDTEAETVIENNKVKSSFKCQDCGLTLIP